MCKRTTRQAVRVAALLSFAFFDHARAFVVRRQGVRTKTVKRSGECLQRSDDEMRAACVASAGDGGGGGGGALLCVALLLSADTPRFLCVFFFFSFVRSAARCRAPTTTARFIVEKYYPRLTLDFHTNKRLTNEVAQLPSKRVSEAARLFALLVAWRGSVN